MVALRIRIQRMKGNTEYYFSLAETEILYEIVQKVFTNLKRMPPSYLAIAREYNNNQEVKDKNFKKRNETGIRRHLIAMSFDPKYPLVSLMQEVRENKRQNKIKIK